MRLKERLERLLREAAEVQVEYHTACIGKWHLGWEWPGPQPSRMTEKQNGQALLEWDFTKPIAGGPTQRGFDYYFGVDLPNLPPFTYIENDRVVFLPTEEFQPDESEGGVLPKRFAGTPAAPGWRMQDILPEITRRAVRSVQDRAKAKQPFFLYFALTSPHEPIELSGKYRDVVKRMTNELKTLIDRGTSRHGQKAANDTMVRFDTTQDRRWAPALDH